MITYDPKTKTVKMDLVDLEHCGFDHDEYQSELFLSGLLHINQSNPDLEWPEYLMVNFKDGAVKIASDVCPYCNGTGKELANNIKVRCRFCSGTGKK